ncbi:transglycosylase domain-containing protein [Butyrivibrio sp. WCE2006]|uniref:transglycosylase domain-containing protein n=1 Tax=Butyrivibrio sp. WCE2006 TaxID=1410611 RepID=UPI0009DD670A|nr:PBP1A family penicillin-binding protein [Butyrivibrio sp. WCE2006]
MNYGRKGIRDQQHKLTSSTTKWGKKFSLISFELIIMLIIGIVVIGVCAGIGVFRGIIDSAPDIGNISVTPRGYSTFVYDTEGNQTAKLVSTDSNRIPVSWDMIPENLAHAFVAIEDRRFYTHNGIDIEGIVRAAVIGITSKDLTQGASTITQQLLKNNVFTGWTSENSDIAKIKRKIQEQYLALQLEKTMTKEDILLNYLNTINLGSNTLGVQAASLRYFNKPVTNLTLSECAVIAGITQNPSRYNPITHPDNNAKRREKVLNDMLEQGYITQLEYDEAINDDVYARIQVVDQETTDNNINSYFVDALTNQLIDDLIDAGYNETQAYTLLYSGGLKIYSTQDPHIQSICDEIYSDESNYPEGTKYLLDYALTTVDSEGNKNNYSSEMMKSYFQQETKSFNMLFNSKEDAEAAIEEYKAAVVGSDTVEGESVNLTPQPQVSLTVEDHKQGYVVAMVGGRGSKTASRTLNRATDTVRQPGSTFKVLSTYAPALDSAGLTLATVFNDAPFNYPDGRPVNNWYGESYRGLTTIRTAIKDSMNIIAVKTMTLITPQLAFDYLKNFGFTTLAENEEINGKIFTDVQLPTALGGLTHGVTNMELNAAYAAIANGGLYIKPKLYTKVVDHEGNTILDNTKMESTRILKESTAYLLTSAMTDVVTSGTGTAVNFGTTAIAGKTGTTSDENDVWFAGYSTYYTATTWAGYDNNVDLTTKDEQRLAKTMWRAVMSKIHENLPSTTFEKPASVISATVCSRSGKLPIGGLCDGTHLTEYFEEGTVPTDSCNVHYAGTICQSDRYPASEQCPFKITGVFELVPPEPAALQAQSKQSTTANGFTTTVDEAGNTIVTPAATCHHTPEFMAQPNIQEILAQETSLIQQGIVNTQYQPTPNTTPALDVTPAPATEQAPAAEQNAAPAADANPAPAEQQNAADANPAPAVEQTPAQEVQPAQEAAPVEQPAAEAPPAEEDDEEEDDE